MRPPPDAPTALGTVARFLAKEVKVDDRAVAFRLKVCAFLLAAVARDLAAGDTLRAAQVQVFAQLLEQPVPGHSSSAELTAALEGLEAQLADAVAEGQLPLHAALPLLRRQLAMELSMSNPRFDLSDEIELTET